MTRAAEVGIRQSAVAASLAALFAVAIATVAAAAVPQSRDADREIRGFERLDGLLAALDATGLRLELIELSLRELPRLSSQERREHFETVAPWLEDWLSESTSAAERQRRLDLAEAIRGLAVRDEADSWRWPIATGRYLAAASAADRLRGGFPESADFRGLDESFRTAALVFDQLAAEAARDRTLLAARALRTSGVETDLLAEAQQRHEADASRGRFLAGWSHVQRALLAEDLAGAREAARAALERLLPLLDTGSDAPRPLEVSVDRRSDLGFTQTLLGVAIAQRILEGPEEGKAWFGLLEHPKVDPALKASLPIWSWLAALAADDPAGAAAGLSALAERGAIDPGQWRLAVASVWPRALREMRFRSLLDAAILEHARRVGVRSGTGLAASLRELFGGGASPLGEAWAEAFLARRDAEAAEDSAIRRDRHRAAAALLDAAASRTPGELGVALESLALESLVEGGRPEEAIERIRRGESRDETRSWIEVAALDRIRRIAPSAEADEAWAEAARRFLAEFPDHPQASLVAVRLGGERMRVEDLESFARRGDGRLAAEARRALFDRLATAPPAERGAIATAIRDLGATSLERGGTASEEILRREAFEVLEAALVLEAPDAARATRLLESLAPALPQMAPRERASWHLHAAELSLLRGDLAAAADAQQRAWAEAAEAADESWIDAAAPRWLGRVASMALDSAAIAILLEAAAETTLGRVSASDPIRATAAQLAARAAETRWRLEPGRALADRWYVAADRAWESVHSVQLALARAEAAAETARWTESLESAREALALAPRGSGEWRHAKRRQIEALAELDRDQALAVLDQHRVLDPEWDQGEHGAALAAVARRLGSSGRSGSGP